jgi:hypothetical protein
MACSRLRVCVEAYWAATCVFGSSLRFNSILTEKQSGDDNETTNMEQGVLG